MPHGYPKLAAFLESDETFMIYRRFGYIQTRLLLEKQDELRELEEELERKDRLDAQELDRLLMTRDTGRPARKELLQALEQKFLEYAALITAAKELIRSHKPTTNEYNSVRNWFDAVQPIYQTDASYILHKEDLLTLRPGREDSWLDVALQRFLHHIHCPAIENLFTSRETRQKTDGSGGEVF